MEKKNLTAYEVIEIVTAYKNAMQNRNTIIEEMKACQKKMSNHLLIPDYSSSEMEEIGERYLKLKAALEVVNDEISRIWTENEDFFATNNIDF